MTKRWATKSQLYFAEQMSRLMSDATRVVRRRESEVWVAVQCVP